MANKKFKPFLAPNEIVDIKDLQYPLLVSYKLDGIRCIFNKGEMLSRSLKPIVNKQLREKFEVIRQYSETYDLIIDGEIYSPDLTFQEITGFVMSKDFEDKKSIKKHGEVIKIPEDLKFYCFDAIQNDKFDMPFKFRLNTCYSILEYFTSIMNVLKHKTCNNAEEVKDYFEEALKDDYEGLILRKPNGRYKCGRGTINEGLIYKLKPYITFDEKIIDVIQSTKVNPEAEKKINELGRSVTSKKKADRILIEKACDFLVLHEGKTPLKVMIAMTDEEKEEVWKNKEKYIGRYIEYKGLMVGAKDLPRHPVYLRMRKDKDT